MRKIFEELRKSPARKVEIKEGCPDRDDPPNVAMYATTYTEGSRMAKISLTAAHLISTHALT